jgi:hypothetical protein
VEVYIKALIKSDIIEQGKSNYYYRGLQDNIFDKVFRRVYADDIADFDPGEINDEYKTLFIELNKEYNKIQGEYNYFKGQFAEFIILHYLKYRAWKQNKTFCKMMENLPQDFEFNLKIASVLWPNMQDIGYAAIVNYCKYPITQQIRPQDAPEGFACFEFFLTHLFDEII